MIRSFSFPSLPVPRALLAGLAIAVAVLGPPSPVPATAATPAPPHGEFQASPPAPAVDTLPSEAAFPSEMLELHSSVQEVLAIFRRIEGLREIRITIEDRILELSGTALTAEDRDRAGEIAEAFVPGAIWVDNRITVETDLRKRLTPAVERLREKADTGLRFLPSFLLGMLLIGGAFVLAYFAGPWIVPPRAGQSNPFARNLLRQSIRAVIGLAGVLLALELMAVTALVGAVLGAAGVAGIALGFAFRDIVENYLAGVILSLRQPFAPNDHIELGGHEGRIVRLTGRETILMTLDGNHVRIPNATVFKSIMTNFTRNPRRRFMLKVGVAPGTPVAAALEIGMDALVGVQGVLTKPPVSGRVQELGDSSVELRFTGWVDQTGTDFSKVRSEALRALKERFESEGVDTPPPEYGIRILSSEPDTPPAPPSPPGLGLPPADVSPDRTIEEEIARELANSDEENLLQPPPGGAGGGPAG